MINASSNTINTLVVPINVMALCLSELDEPSISANFAGPRVDYRHMASGAAAAYLGTDVNFDPVSDIRRTMSPGVHLHWALPDALTSAKVEGDQSDATLAFRGVPNRWVITRFAIKGDVVTPTSWIVESDALSSVNPGSASSVTLPVRRGVRMTEASQLLASNFVGRAIHESAYRGETARVSGDSFADRTGGPLNAVSGGPAAFAAYYPECGTVFGFQDLVGEAGNWGGPNAPTQACSLMYVVSGWYDDVSQDPAAQARTGGDSLRDALRWSVDDGQDPRHDVSVYSGCVQGIDWNPKRSYLSRLRPTIAVDGAFGANPVEAMAAFMRDKLPGGGSAVRKEHLLSLVQRGELHTLTGSDDFSLEAVERLHEAQFRAVRGETLLHVTQKNRDGEEIDTDLNPVQSAALAAYNGEVARLDAMRGTYAGLQWRAFANWYRLASYYKSTQYRNMYAACFEYHQDIVEQAGDLADEITDLEDALKIAHDQLDQMLLPGQSLGDAPGAMYFRPADPALLLSSAAELRPHQRYGGDTQWRADGTLACRDARTLIDTVTVNQTRIDGARYQAVARLPDALPHREIFSALLVEACLLNSDLAFALTPHGKTREELAVDLKALLAGRTQSSWRIDPGEQAPSPVAVEWWNGANPWLPLLVTWTANFTPDHRTRTADAVDGARESDGGEVEASKTVDYPEDFFRSGFVVDTTTGSFVRQTGSVGLGKAQRIGGIATLSRGTADNFAKLIDTSPELRADLKAVRDVLAAHEIVVQPLAGLTDEMLMRRQRIELLIGTNDKVIQSIAAETSALCGANPGAGPSWLGAYNPIRAGNWTLEARVIDVFGQIRDVVFKSLVASETLAPASASGVAKQWVDSCYAAPRLSQAARLTAVWNSASTGAEMAEAAGLPETPICGWLLPEYLSDGFYLFDAPGTPLGLLRPHPVGDAVMWLPTPGGLDATLAEALLDVHPLMADLVRRLAGMTKADFVTYRRAVGAALSTIRPGLRGIAERPSAVLGRPLAVGALSIGLDMLEPAYFDQDPACLVGAAWQDVDAGFPEVEFPVYVGNADKLADGVVGYYRFVPSPGGGTERLDLETMFSPSAAEGSTRVVVRPNASTLPVVARGPENRAKRRKLLVLFDAQAELHVIAGIVPTRRLSVPSRMVASALDRMEVALPAAPVLFPPGRSVLPLPKTPGGTVTWLANDRSPLRQDGGGWITDRDVGPAGSDGIWAYTPQHLAEGWLVIRRDGLDVKLLNDDDRPVLRRAVPQTGVLRIVNRGHAALGIGVGDAVPESETSAGTIIYLHLERLDLGGIDAVAFDAAGWTATLFGDDRVGRYWALTYHGAPFDLSPGESINIGVRALCPNSAHAHLSYILRHRGVGGLGDGTVNGNIVLVG